MLFTRISTLCGPVVSSTGAHGFVHISYREPFGEKPKTTTKTTSTWIYLAAVVCLPCSVMTPMLFEKWCTITSFMQCVLQWYWYAICPYIMYIHRYIYVRIVYTASLHLSLYVWLLLTSVVAAHAGHKLPTPVVADSRADPNVQKKHRIDTGVCEQTHSFCSAWAWAMRPSSRVCNPAPDSVFF